MNNKKVIFAIVLVLVLLIGGASVLYSKLGDEYASPQLAGQETNDESKTDIEVETKEEEVSAAENAEEEQTAPAPDFTMYDAAGNVVKLSDFFGKPIVLNFWASWCGPCKSEMPDFDEAYGIYGEEIRFLMVNMTDGNSETIESASAYVEKCGYSFPVYYDKDNEAAITYRVFSIPTTYFIDAEGNIVTYGSGALNMETLLTGIKMIYDK